MPASLTAASGEGGTSSRPARGPSAASKLAAERLDHAERHEQEAGGNQEHGHPERVEHAPRRRDRSGRPSARTAW